MDKPDPSSPSQQSTGPYISPKLREKLEGGGGGGRTPRSEDQLPAWAGWLVIGLLVVAVAVVGMGMARSNAEKKHKAEIAHADSLKAAAAAESLAAAMRDTLRAESLRVATASPKPGAKAATPASASKPAAGASASHAAASTATKPAAGASAAPAAETRRYGLIVGEYLDEDKANSEKDRLTGSTSLPGRVVSIDNGGSFRVILGSFEGRAAAEKAAADLSGKGLVNEARVTALPK